jgi:hypothetical protein
MTNEMKRKTITLGILCILLLTTLATGIAKGEITKEATNNPGLDLAVEFIPLHDMKNNQIGLAVVVKNVGTEIAKGPINGTLYVKSGYFGIKTIYTNDYTILEGWEELSPGAERIGAMYSPIIHQGFHINLFQYKLNFNDENSDNNIRDQRAISLSIFIFSRMHFI